MYLRIRTDLTERCREEHGRTVRFLREQLGEHRPLQRVTPLDARRFLAWYRKRMVKDSPVAPSTSNKVLRECRRIFREAVDCQFIKSNPFAGIRPSKVADTPWHHITPNEFHALLNATGSIRWQGMIMLAYCCGLRIGEILNLTWDDVDFKASTVRIVAKRGAATEDWVPKDKEMRVVPLPAPVTVPLAKLRLAARAETPYVFTLDKGANAGKRMRRQNTWRDFDVIRRRAGLPPCSMHDLRRSYCTDLSRSMPMHVVQELAGHSDIRTTRRYYVKVQPELFDEARRVVEKAVAS
jgi:integrase